MEHTPLTHHTHRLTHHHTVPGTLPKGSPPTTMRPKPPYQPSALCFSYLYLHHRGRGRDPLRRRCPLKTRHVARGGPGGGYGGCVFSLHVPTSHARGSGGGDAHRPTSATLARLVGVLFVMARFSLALSGARSGSSTVAPPWPHVVGPRSRLRSHCGPTVVPPWWDRGRDCGPDP